MVIAPTANAAIIAATIALVNGFVVEDDIVAISIVGVSTSLTGQETRPHAVLFAGVTDT